MMLSVTVTRDVRNRVLHNPKKTARLLQVVKYCNV